MKIEEKEERKKKDDIKENKMETKL